MHFRLFAPFYMPLYSVVLVQRLLSFDAREKGGTDCADVYELTEGARTCKTLRPTVLYVMRTHGYSCHHQMTISLQ